MHKEVPVHKSYAAERRQAERIQCLLKTTYRLPGEASRSAETRNISDGGLLLMVSGDVKKDDVLDLVISLGADREPLKTRARVVHRHRESTARGTEDLAGLQFLSLNDQQQEALGRKIWEQILRESTRFGKQR